VPPLRKRRTTSPCSCEHFLALLNDEKGRQIEGIGRAALERLVEHDWPGNVRELENLIERLVVMRGRGIIDVDDLPAALRRPTGAAPLALPALGPDGIAFNEVVDRLETSMIVQALERTSWNKNRAAQLLGLNRTTLLEKIKKKKLEPPEGMGD
jgi:DNA-binding NtrC family response regulator